MSSKNFFILDASSYVFRAYHAINYLENSKGFPTNAIFGFVTMINKLLEETKPDYFAAVFDSGGKSFRNDIFDEYKANRGEAPEDISLQFPIIIDFLKAKGVRVLSMENYEADDVIGSLVKKFKSKHNIIILSGDKDFTQLIDSKVTMIDTMRNRTTSVDEVVKKYGLSPKQMIDFFSLVGDSIDNIPGVKGIGPKTAEGLLGKHKTLENLYKNLDKVENERIRNLLLDYQEEANLSKELVTIKTDLNISLQTEDFKIIEPDEEALNNLFVELEFESFVDQKTNYRKVENSNYKSILTIDDFQELLSNLNKSDFVSLDLETTSPNPIEAEIVGISFSFIEETGFYIPISHKEEIDQLKIDYIIKNLKPILENEKIKKIGQNIKYEIIVFSKYGVNLKGIFFDTMIAAHFLDSSLQTYSLDNLSRRFLNHQMITYKEVTTIDKKSIPFSDVKIDTAVNYSCEDADITLRLFYLFSKKLKENKLMSFFTKYEIPFIYVLAQMEKEGVKIDQKKLKSLSKEFNTSIKKTQKKIYKQVDEEFNINSPLQLRKILFEKLNLKPFKKTKKGEFSTDSESIQNIINQHDVLNEILLFRFYSKLKSTYLDLLPELVFPDTKKIHTSYNHVGTATGRLSSSNPNLQNIPIKTTEGKRIREAFVSSDKDSIIVSADYSQIELRLLAHFSKDKEMIKSFKSGEDIHTKTASEIFNLRKHLVSEEQRRIAKTINFGILYGIGAKRLALQINQDTKTARKYIEKYFERYSGVKEFFEKIKNLTRQKGYAETILKRRRYIETINSNNFALRAAAERAAINTPIQGSASDVIKQSMIYINDDFSIEKHCKMIIQVHDELVFEVKKNKIEYVSERIISHMENSIKLNVPLVVELKSGKTWADSH